MGSLFLRTASAGQYGTSTRSLRAARELKKTLATLTPFGMTVFVFEDEQ